MNGLSSNPFSTGNIVPITNPEPNSLDTKERSQLIPNEKIQDPAQTVEQLTEEAFQKVLDSIEIKKNCSPTKGQVEKIFGCGKVDFIAKGSFGTVYKTKKKYPTAIKVGVRSKESYNAFVKEISAYLDIQENGGSLNIVEMLWYGQHQGCPLMELTSAKNASDLFKFFKKVSFNPFYAKLILAGTLEGLKFLHEMRRVHGDVKPNNLLLCWNDNSMKCVITDLGNSHKIGPSEEEKDTPHQQGNVFYRDPAAIFTGKITPKSDLWALGMVIYTLICKKEFSIPSHAKNLKELNTAGVPSPGKQRLLFQTIHRRFEEKQQNELDKLIPKSSKKVWDNFRIFLKKQKTELWKKHHLFQKFSEQFYEEKDGTVKGSAFEPILNALFKIPFNKENTASSILKEFKILH